MKAATKNWQGSLFRQGDVLVIATEKRPEGKWKKQPRTGGCVVLAHGKVTGHNHQFRAKGVTLYRADGIGDALLKVERKAKLVHDEHAAIEVPKGLYTVRIQREWNGEISQRVED